MQEMEPRGASQGGFDGEVESSGSEDIAAGSGSGQTFAQETNAQISTHGQPNIFVNYLQSAGLGMNITPEQHPTQGMSSQTPTQWQPNIPVSYSQPAGLQMGTELEQRTTQGMNLQIPMAWQPDVPINYSQPAYHATNSELGQSFGQGETSQMMGLEDDREYIASLYRINPGHLPTPGYSTLPIDSSSSSYSAIGSGLDGPSAQGMSSQAFGQKQPNAPALYYPLTPLSTDSRAAHNLSSAYSAIDSGLGGPSAQGMGYAFTPILTDSTVVQRPGNIANMTPYPSATSNPLPFPYQTNSRTLDMSGSPRAKSSNINLGYGHNKWDFGMISTGISSAVVDNESKQRARVVSEFLQENHENNHIYEELPGKYSHLAQGLLTLYGLKASLPTIWAYYAMHKSKSRMPLTTPENPTSIDYINTPASPAWLGKLNLYHEFVKLFELRIDESEFGVAGFLEQYLFSGETELGDILPRCIGPLQPMIHISLGIEFGIPAIIAEGLALACIGQEGDARGQNLLAIENFAVSMPQTDKTLVDICSEIRSAKRIWENVSHSEHGIPLHALGGLAAQWNVIDIACYKEKAAEMANTAVFLTFGARDYARKILTHSPYIKCILATSFFMHSNMFCDMSPGSKLRLLKLKAYSDLALYNANGSPELQVTQIINYKIRAREAPGHSNNINTVFDYAVERLRDIPDDGTFLRLLKSVVMIHQYHSAGFENRHWAVINGAMWIKIMHMIVDTVEGY